MFCSIKLQEQAKSPRYVSRPRCSPRTGAHLVVAECARVGGLSDQHGPPAAKVMCLRGAAPHAGRTVSEVLSSFSTFFPVNSIIRFAVMTSIACMPETARPFRFLNCRRAWSKTSACVHLYDKRAIQHIATVKEFTEFHGLLQRASCSRYLHLGVPLQPTCARQFQGIIRISRLISHMECLLSMTSLLSLSMLPETESGCFTT